MRLAALLLAALLVPQSADERADALRRRVAELPRAVEPWAGRWEDPASWPEERRRAYGECLRLDTVESDLVGALAELQALLAREPDLPPALHQLGVICFRLRRHGDGVEAFERFLVQAPEHVGRTRALGHCLYSLGRHDEALAHYDRVLAAAPDDVEARFGRALALHRSGGPGALDAALDELDAVLASGPEHADAAYWRARLLFDEERGEDAELLADARRAAELAPFDPRPAHLVAELHLALGDAEAADEARVHARRLARAAEERRALDERLLLDPADLVALEGRARTALAVGDVDSARADLRRAARVALARGEVRLAEAFARRAEALR